jgi:hypothetical protein
MSVPRLGPFLSGKADLRWFSSAAEVVREPS